MNLVENELIEAISDLIVDEVKGGVGSGIRGHRTFRSPVPGRQRATPETHPYRSLKEEDLKVSAERLHRGEISRYSSKEDFNEGTLAVKNYTDGNFKRIKKDYEKAAEKRAKGDTTFTEGEKSALLLQDMLSANVLAPDTVLHRGMSWDGLHGNGFKTCIKKLEPGTELEFNSMSSFSTSKKVATKFANSKYYKMTMEFRDGGSKGLSVKSLSGFEEDEVVLAAGQKVKIVKRTFLPPLDRKGRSSKVHFILESTTPVKSVKDREANDVFNELFFYPLSDRAETKIKSIGLSTIFKGGPGSGIRGHRTFRATKTRQRNPHYDDVSSQMSKNLKGIASGKAEHTAVKGDLAGNVLTISKNMMNEADLYTNYLASDTAVKTRDFIRTYERTLLEGVQRGEFKNIKAADLDAFGVDCIRKMAHQEVESNRQQFTDHGIRHITGNIDRQIELMDAMGGSSAMDKLSAIAIMTNHDMGYTIKETREGKGFGKGHPDISKGMFDNQKDQWNKDKIFSSDQFDKISGIIKTHDSTEQSNDKLTDSARFSDNLALFAKEKLPSMFKYVQGGGSIIGQMKAAGDDSGKFEEARNNLYKAIDSSGLNKNLKRDLKAATKRANPMTAQFAIGTLAGEISSIKAGKNKSVDVTVKYNAWDSFLQGQFDMGQAQTKKLLKDYGITDYSKTEYDLGRIRIRVVGARKKEIGLGMVLKHLPGRHDQQSHGRGNDRSAGRRGHYAAIFKMREGMTPENVEKAIDSICKDTGFDRDKADKVLSSVTSYSALGKGTRRDYGIKSDIVEDFIKASPKFDAPIYRGIGFSGTLTAGDIIAPKRFTSWSSYRSVAGEFSEKKSRSGNKMILVLPKTNSGVSIQHLSLVAGEGEVLVSRNVGFRVKDIEQYSAQDYRRRNVKIRRVTVEEVPLPVTKTASDQIISYDEVSESTWLTIQEKWERDFDLDTFEVTKSLGLSSIFKHGTHDQSTHGNRHTGGSKEPITQEDKNLQSSISQISQMMKINKRPEGWQNSSGYELVEKDGKFFTPAELPEGVKSGKTKECYTNAGRLALDYPEKYTYVEGFSSSFGIPMSHAWCIDNKTGKVVDPTWSKKNGLTVGKSYFGIAFSENYLRETILKTGTWGMIPDYPTDNHNPMKNGFPVGAFRKKSVSADKIDYDQIKDKPKDKVNYHYIEDYLIGGNIKGLEPEGKIFLQSEMKGCMEFEGLVFKSDEMSADKWIDAWKNDPHFGRSTTHSPLAKEFLDLLIDGKTVLEIGCGNGRDSIYLQKNGCKVSAIDLSPEAISIARKNDKEGRVLFEVGDAEQLKYEDSSFDGVYSLSVLHSTNMEKSIPEVARVLKSGGVFLVYLYHTTIFPKRMGGETTVIAFKKKLLEDLFKQNSFVKKDSWEFEVDDTEDDEPHIHKVVVYVMEKS